MRTSQPKLIYPICCLLLVLAVGIWLRPAHANGTQAITPATELDLQAYASTVAGLWESQEATSEEGFSILIDPRLIEGNQLKVIESEYCRPGMAEYLHFELQKQKLTYVGASMDGCFFDLDRIHFIDMWYELSGKDTLLMYEAAEMEHANYQKCQLYRKSLIESPSALWQCALQEHLIEFLRAGQYDIYDAEGESIDPQRLFATQSMFGEVYYYDAYTAFWPDYEELCVQAPFEIVMLGGVDKEVFAIHWKAEEISLFNTFRSEKSQGDIQPLEKGNLRYRIIPIEPQPRPKTETDLFK